LRAALFDMDRTLVRGETARLYLRYARDRGVSSWTDDARALGWMAAYALGFADVRAVATRALDALRGTHETVLAARCDDWFRREVEQHVCDAGRRAVAQHREQGEIVAIVTAAIPHVARPLARRLAIDHVVASELEVASDGRFTGRLSGQLNYGTTKVQRAAELATALGFQLKEATFYSDSCSDLPLLEAVRTPVAVNPDTKLERIARGRGWRVERW
jgi:HAD superfamily hydrolase (TIGR01490 family)